jgi:hypothetical protein
MPDHKEIYEQAINNSYQIRQEFAARTHIYHPPISMKYPPHYEKSGPVKRFTKSQINQYIKQAA